MTGRPTLVFKGSNVLRKDSTVNLVRRIAAIGFAAALAGTVGLTVASAATTATTAGCAWDGQHVVASAAWNGKHVLAAAPGERAWNGEPAPSVTALEY